MTIYDLMIYNLLFFRYLVISLSRYFVISLSRYLVISLSRYNDLAHYLFNFLIF